MAGSFGKIEVFNDFLGIYDSVVWGAANLVSGDGLGGWGFTSVNEGSFASTVDEPGGILAITTDTADNDNAALIVGKFKPADGVMTMETRLKYSSTDTSVFVGFSETMALDTPVMPAEFATVTMTYNGTGGMVGLQYDVDGTTDDWRALMGDGGAAAGTLTRAQATVTADRWATIRVVMYPDTSAEVWLSDVGHLASNGQPYMRLIKKFAAGLTATDLFYAVIMAENRSGNARVLEVDYAYACGGRDWLTT